MTALRALDRRVASLAAKAFDARESVKALGDTDARDRLQGLAYVAHAAAEGLSNAIELVMRDEPSRQGHRKPQP